MTRSRALAVATSALALVLVGICGAFWVNNPSINGTSVGAVGCLAPYDIVLNDANGTGGGEPPVDSELIDKRCRAAGQERFDRGVPYGVAGLLASALAIPLLWRNRQHRS